MRLPPRLRLSRDGVTEAKREEEARVLERRAVVACRGRQVGSAAQDRRVGCLSAEEESTVR